MKTKLFTQDLFLGLLMTLVLALGVQGVAEAITRPSGQTEAHVNTVDSTVRDIGNSLSITSIDIAPDKTNVRETVTISRSSGITLTGDFYGLSSVSLREVDDDLTDTTNGSSFTYTRDGRTQTISGTATGAIGITFTAKGTQWVKISATDYDDPDVDDDFSGSWSATYTYYVKGPGTSTTTISLLGLRNGYKTGIFAGTAHRERIHTGDGGHYDVTYTTIPDDAMAQIETTAGALGDLAALNDASTSSALDVLLQATKTYQVTAKVKDSDRETIGVYIIGTPTLIVGHPGDPDGDPGTATVILGSKDTPGRINDTLPAEISPTTRAFTATVTDGLSTPGTVPGVVVKFQVRGSGRAGGYLVFGSSNAGTLVESNNRMRLNSSGGELTEATDKVLYVRTDPEGKADVDFQLGTDRKQDVTISAVGQSKVVSAYTGTAAGGNQLVEPESRSSQASGHAGEYELSVKAVNADGDALPQQHVEFRTSDGTLDDPSTPAAATPGGRLPVRTDTQGIAFVFFDPNEDSDSLRVTAHLLDTATTETAPTITDSVIDDVVFNIKGGSPPPPPPAPQQRNRLTISTTGEGTTRSVTVNALTTTNAPISGLSVVLSGTALTTAQTVTTGAAVSITLPSTSGDYTLIATDPNGTFDTGTVTVTVSAPGTLEVTLGTRTGNQQPITVRAVRGGSAQSAVNITITGGATSVSRQTDSSGRASAIVTLPTATGAHTLTVRATGGYDPAQITVPAVTGEPTRDPSEPTTTRGTAGVADSIQISGQVFRTGTVNTQLDLPLSVRVLDGNGRGVEDVKVTFRLQTGQGRLSQRGNGRATAVDTDRNGYARAPYTPLARGTSTVRVKAAGVTQTVTFTITVNGASDPETNTGADDTPRVTDDTPRSREINPVVQVNAQNRPPMLWVDSGKIYALVGAEVQAFILGVEGAMNIAIGDDRVYWTERTGESSGTINSVNLNGSDAKQLASIQAVPMGIAVDTIRSKLYWTNSRGRIQSANLDGSRIQNVIQGSSNRLIDLLLSGNNLYFTQSDESGPIGRIDPTLSGEQIAFWDDNSMPGTPGSLAIANGKLYWTAKTGESSGTINSVNLNGSDAKQLASIQAVPMGIAVDTIRSKLYWTNSRGRVQSANLNGSGIRNVVTGLGMPGDMVLSNSIKAPTEAPEKSTTIAAGKSKYDINGDGSVDDKDVDMLLLAVLSELTAAKYDVNGDGSVDAKDVREVNKNLDKAAAGAPALLGRKFSAIQRDRLQAQIDLLVASSDRSPATLKTLVYLQQLLATARPEKTQLLANYPNPFNPETWIPYELAMDTDVKITIYNAQGVVIRTLQLGQQAAGYYTDRERAAYWDGRNALGERVASGIYFYQLETDTMSALRKMVILK